MEKIMIVLAGVVEIFMIAVLAPTIRLGWFFFIMPLAALTTFMVVRLYQIEQKYRPEEVA